MAQWQTKSAIASPGWLQAALAALKTVSSAKRMAIKSLGSAGFHAEKRTPGLKRITEGIAIETALATFTSKILSEGDLYVLGHDNLSSNIHLLGMNRALETGIKDVGYNPTNTDLTVGGAVRRLYRGAGALVDEYIKEGFAPSPFEVWLREFTDAFFDKGDENRPPMRDSYKIAGVIFTVQGRDPTYVYRRLRDLNYIIGEMQRPPLRGGVISTDLPSWRTVRGGISKNPDGMISPGKREPDFKRVSVAEMIPYVRDVKRWADYEAAHAQQLQVSPFKLGVNQDLMSGISITESAVIDTISQYLKVLGELAVSVLAIPESDGTHELVKKIEEASSTREDPVFVERTGGAVADVGDIISLQKAQDLSRRFTGFRYTDLEAQFIGGVGLFGDSDLIKLLVEAIAPPQPAEEKIVHEVPEMRSTKGPKKVFYREKAKSPFFPPGAPAEVGDTGYSNVGADVAVNARSFSTGRVLSFDYGSGRGNSFGRNTAQVGPRGSSYGLYLGPGYAPKPAEVSSTNAYFSVYDLPFQASSPVVANSYWYEHSFSVRVGDPVVQISGANPGVLPPLRRFVLALGTGLSSSTQDYYGYKYYSVLDSYVVGGDQCFVLDRPVEPGSGSDVVIWSVPKISTELPGISKPGNLAYRKTFSPGGFRANLATTDPQYAAFSLGTEDDLVREPSFFRNLSYNLDLRASPTFPGMRGQDYFITGPHQKENAPISLGANNEFPPATRWLSSEFRLSPFPGDKEAYAGDIQVGKYAVFTVYSANDAPDNLAKVPALSLCQYVRVYAGTSVDVLPKSSAWDGTQVTLPGGSYDKVEFLLDTSQLPDAFLSSLTAAYRPSIPAWYSLNSASETFRSDLPSPPECAGAGVHSSPSWAELAVLPQEKTPKGVSIEIYPQKGWPVGPSESYTVLDTLNHRILAYDNLTFELLERDDQNYEPGVLGYTSVATISAQDGDKYPVPENLTLGLYVGEDPSSAWFLVQEGGALVENKQISLQLPLAGGGEGLDTAYVGSSPRNYDDAKKIPQSSAYQSPSQNLYTLSLGAPPLTLASYSTYQTEDAFLTLL